MSVIKIIDNGLKAEDLVSLWVAVGFLDDPSKYPLEQAEKAILNGLFNVIAVSEGKVIGMGRLVGDGVMYWYLQEICVVPEYQGKGIGKAIVSRLIAYAEQHSIPGTRVTVGLMAAKDKEPFYEKFGFCKRPNDGAGCGMTKRLYISDCTR